MNMSAGSAGINPGTRYGSQLSERQIYILVIDDNRDFARMFCALFSHLGYRAVAESDPEPAIRKIRETKPDLVFCDIGLPARGGFVLAEAVRADASLRDTYLVALSCFEKEKDEQLALKAGFDLYISKPIRTSILETVLKTVRKRMKAPRDKVPATA